MATDTHPMHRILVALDPADPHGEVLDVVSSLGGRETVLEGLFVEDTNVLKLARLSIAREITLAPAGERSLDVSAVERQLRAQASIVRRAFETAADRLGMKHSFRITRGEVISELTACAEQFDVLIIGRAGHTARERSWLGQDIHAVGHRAPRTVIYVQGIWQTGRSVVVLPDNLESRSRALETAARIALREGLALTVLAREGQTMRPSIRQGLGLDESRIRYRPAGPITAQALIDIAASEHARVMVLPAHRAELEGEGLMQLLLARLEASLALTRESD